jgi:hypothetical protein
LRLPRHARAGFAGLAATAILTGLIQTTAPAFADPGPRTGPAGTPKQVLRPSIPVAERTRLLGERWKQSADLAWTTTSDAQGFHVLTATEKSGYAWKTTASLSEPGFDADAWIGNACVTGSGKHAVVVYAPRTFTNKPKLMARGGFTAVVDLATGSVRKLNLNASLSYYNPGCGTGETSVLTQSPGEDRTRTRLTTVDAVTGGLGRPITVKGQVTSAVPAGEEIAAATAGRVVTIRRDGRVKTLAKTHGVPYDLTPDQGGGIVFVDRMPRKKNAEARVGVKRTTGHGPPSLMASGPQSATGVTRSGKRVFVTGEVTAEGPEDQRADGGQVLPGTDKDAIVSTRARVLVEHTMWADGKGSPRSLHPKTATDTRAVNITTRILDTGRTTRFTVRPLASKAPGWAEGRERSPALGKPTPAKTAGPSLRAQTGTRTETVESDRTCSVPRNDPRNQALQPKPRQVEWAVDRAVQGELNMHVSRPANWKNLGMPAYQPQTLFLNPALEGGGRVPAQVLLGVTTQESNMWQAGRSAVPGVTGNPLIGNYYGIDYYDGNSDNDWDVDWSGADCGYGITQVTDHMRMAGREHGKGGTAWDYDKQRAVALDYTANIAAGLQILVSKWNQTRKAGLVVNDGKPEKLENWTFALWAYNAGFYENVNGNEPWGVGWANNPANPEWDASRTPFMEDALGNERASAAAHPQDWPYQEKVLGFAAHPPSFLESPGNLVAAFRPAWWNGTGGDATMEGSAKWNRAKVKPPEDLFCGPYNECNPAKISDGAHNEPGAGPCERSDFKCWWHQSVTWKTDCSYSCGNEFVRFNSTYPEEADGIAYPPNCTRAGLPDGAMVIDDVPQGTPSVRPNCMNGGWLNEGTFSVDFGEGEAGLAHDGQSIILTWPSKVDLQQLGAGFGGHFYFHHTRADDPKGQRLKAVAQWKLNKAVDGPAKIWVHLPDHGAQTKYARYEIDTARGKRYRIVNTKGDTNRWVPIGGFMFNNNPTVRLSTITRDGTGDEDIAFDAIAVQPIKGTYVEDEIEAAAFFDEDQDIDTRPESGFADTPLKSREALYDWAVKTAQKVLDLPSCPAGGPGPDDECVKAGTRAAAKRWLDEVKTAGTSTTDHPDGKGITNWMNYSNPHNLRPDSDGKPSWFGTDDAAYKMLTKATVSYIKTDDGKIVDGSEWAVYDDRTADTHIPRFVRDFFQAVQEDYGVAPPDLNYTAKNLNEYTGRETTTTTNSDGILPGLAYRSIGVRPVVTDNDDNPAGGDNGTCVAAMYAAGGSIGYRRALGSKHLTDSVENWGVAVSAKTGVVSNPVSLMAQEIRNMFFKPGITGSIFGQAPPIWQELNFKTCTDGTIKKISGAPVLRSSYMPSQYLYRNGKAIGLDGAYTFSRDPVTKGDFYHFSGVGLDNPYANCTMTSGHSGNPWDIGIPTDPDNEPTDPRFCAAPGKKADAEFSR